MHNNLFILLIFCVSVLAGYYFTPFFIDVFSRGGRLAENYKGELIPQGIGIVFVLYILPWYAIYLIITKLNLLEIIYLINILILSMAFFAESLIGFFDDMVGSRDTLGLKGHFKALLSGRLTTGALKAIVGLLISFIMSMFFCSGLFDIIINTLMMALFINLLNLFDLRPGRAIKFYILLILVFGINAIFTGNYISFLLMIPLIGSIIGYFPFDLKARCMMGDAGSNVLGISAGIFATFQFGHYEKIVTLLLLVAIHIFTEKYSLSDVIKHNRILSFLDNLGR